MHTTDDKQARGVLAEFRPRFTLRRLLQLMTAAAIASAIGVVAPDPLLLIATGAVDACLLGASVAAAVSGSPRTRAAGIAAAAALFWIRGDMYGQFRLPAFGVGPFVFLGYRGVQSAAVVIQWLGVALCGLMAYGIAGSLLRQRESSSLPNGSSEPRE